MIPTLRHRISILIAIALFAFSLPVTAQVLKGSISGAIADPNGNRISGVTIKATSVDTGSEITTTTDRYGMFRMNLIATGKYNVQVTSGAFRPLEIHNILVIAGKDAALTNVFLSFGAPSSNATRIDISQPQVKGSFSGWELSAFVGIQENAGVGLDYLALFVPGVADPRDVSFSNYNGNEFSVNGLRSRSNDQQIDGQYNNDSSIGGPVLFVSDPEFMQQYVLTTNQLGPEAGRNSGSVVNVITKQGTNNWHGSIYGSEGNSRLNSITNYGKSYQPLKSIPKSNDAFAGATIGGPLLRDKLFVFGGTSFEIFNTQTNYRNSGLTPTPLGLQQLTACFPTSTSVSALRQFGPYGVVEGNPTPVNLQLQNVGTCNLVQLGGVSRTLSTPVHLNESIVRSDLRLGPNTITARYLFNRQTDFNTSGTGRLSLFRGALSPAEFSSTAAGGYPVNEQSVSHSILLSWTRSLGTQMVNEGRFGFGRLDIEFGGNDAGNSVPSTSNFSDSITRVEFTPSNLLGFGASTTLPQGRIADTWQAQDNWNYVAGRHRFKAGVNYTSQRGTNVFMPEGNGRYTYASWTSFVNNTPSSVELRIGDPNFKIRQNDTFLYFGDDWRVTSNLTLIPGITWSYFGSPADVLQQSIETREQGNQALWNSALPLSVRTTTAPPVSKTNFGPSIGFAYTPQGGGFLAGHGRSAIRGGYRVLYDPPFYNILMNTSYRAPAALPVTFSGASAANKALPDNPTGKNVAAALAPFVTPGTLDPRSSVQTRIADDFGPDKVESWNLGYERQLGGSSVFEVRYVGNRASKLFRAKNGNPYIADLKANFPAQVPSDLVPCPSLNAAIPTAVGRVNCQEGIVQRIDNSGHSRYNALQLEYRVSNRQLTFRAAYTWSRTLDNSSEIYSTFAAGNTIAYSQNPADPNKDEFKTSGLDIPHVLTMTFSEQFPFFSNQQGWKGKAFGGWGVAATNILASGQPYTPAQLGEARFLTTGDYYDLNFISTFNESLDIARPFLGNPSAPVNVVGVYAGDACSLYGIGCSTNQDQLISLNAINGPTPGALNTSTNSVRFILNARRAQTIFNTPFGNAERNSLRDIRTNETNISIFKLFTMEGSSLELRATATNVFNLLSSPSVSPFVDLAGASNGAFSEPTLTDALGRRIYFAARFRF